MLVVSILRRRDLVHIGSSSQFLNLYFGAESKASDFDAHNHRPKVAQDRNDEINFTYELEREIKAIKEGER